MGGKHGGTNRYSGYSVLLQNRGPRRVGICFSLEEYRHDAVQEKTSWIGWQNGFLFDSGETKAPFSRLQILHL